MGKLVIQQPTLSGTALSFVAADSNGDTFVNQGNVFIYIKNGGETEITVTTVAQKKCNQGHLHDSTITVPAGDDRIVGPFEVDRFNSDTNVAKITYSAVDSVTVAAIRL